MPYPKYTPLLRVPQGPEFLLCTVTGLLRGLAFLWPPSLPAQLLLCVRTEIPFLPQKTSLVRLSQNGLPVGAHLSGHLAY